MDLLEVLGWKVAVNGVVDGDTIEAAVPLRAAQEEARRKGRGLWGLPREELCRLKNHCHGISEGTPGCHGIGGVGLGPRSKLLPLFSFDTVSNAARVFRRGSLPVLFPEDLVPTRAG